MVDNFFGGVGRHAKIEGREFTATEMRVVHMFLRSAFADMKEAWQPIAQIDVEYLQLGDQPEFRQHRHALGSRGGVPVPHRARRRRRRSLHVVMPYSMIEPLREVLDSGVQSDRAEQDERWAARCSRKDCRTPKWS